MKWSLQNIRNGINDKLTVDSNEVQIPQGYYSFQDLKTFLKSHKISIEKLKDNRITLTSEKDLNLSSFGPFLGFVKDKSITKSTSYTSQTPADFVNGLRKIDIHSSIVDNLHNFQHDPISNYYYYSSILTTLPIDTTQNLNGTFTRYDLSSVAIPTVNSNNREITFNVISDGALDDYEIFLDIEINV